MVYRVSTAAQLCYRELVKFPTLLKQSVCREVATITFLKATKAPLQKNETVVVHNMVASVTRLGCCKSYSFLGNKFRSPVPGVFNKFGR